jgi:hypothetical protein
MIDGIELAVVYHVTDIGHFDHGQPVIFQEQADAANDSIQIGDVSKDVIGVDNICALTLLAQSFRQTLIEEVAERGNAVFVSGDARYIRSRFNAEDGHAGSFVMLQEIAIVTGYFYHQAIRA